MISVVSMLRAALPVLWYLEGQGDVVSGLITPVTHLVTMLTSLINLQSKSP